MPCLGRYKARQALGKHYRLAAYLLTLPSTQRALAASGMGIVALPDVLVREHLAHGQLVRVLPEWSLPSMTVWCVTPGRRLLPLRTRAFMDLLREAIQTVAT